MYDGHRRRLDKLGELSGSSVPRSILSTERVIMLMFVSDYSIEESGFKIKYEAGGL